MILQIHRYLLTPSMAALNFATVSTLISLKFLITDFHNSEFSITSCFEPAESVNHAGWDGSTCNAVTWVADDLAGLGAGTCFMKDNGCSTAVNDPGIEFVKFVTLLAE